MVLPFFSNSSELLPISVFLNTHCAQIVRRRLGQLLLELR